MFTATVGRIIDQLDLCPWGGIVGHTATGRFAAEHARPAQGLYTPEQRARRDASPWTAVQGVLAPAQFAVFLVSFALVARFLLTGEGEAVATASIVFKTAVLYLIMVTGSIWERAVFGRYLFAPAFWWEDAVSMVVLALHTTYLVSLLTGALDVRAQMFLALAAYSTYVINAAQFVLKLQAARRETPSWPAGARGGARA
jgi:3-vinyl bacteriochlorophyllide hydratase